ncbi:hypothetical protein OAG68_02100 [bacterium]|nr:hypothetical protein [bacterium]
MTERRLSQHAFEQTVNGVPKDWDEMRLLLQTTQEELLPELQAAMSGHVIRHPLLVATTGSIAMNNFLLLSKRREIENAEKETDWFKYIFTHEKPFQLSAFMDVAERMDDRTYWELASSVYTQSENLHQNQAAIRQVLTSDRPERTAMMTTEEQQFLDGLPSQVEIFRGFAFDNSRGWSWTISRDKAEWFANRYAKELGGITRVASGSIAKCDVIAYLDGRDEKEIVCDPKSIDSIKTDRLDGKKDTPRVVREDKFEFDSYNDMLKMHMVQNPTMTLTEMSSAFELMHEEASILIEKHGDEALCGIVNTKDLDSSLLRMELTETRETELGDVPGTIEAAAQDVDILIDEHGGETLCGDFDFS